MISTMIHRARQEGHGTSARSFLGRACWVQHDLYQGLISLQLLPHRQFERQHESERIVRRFQLGEQVEE